MIGQQAIQGFSENGYVGVDGLNLFVKRADETARIAHRPHQNILMPAVGRKRQEDVTVVCFAEPHQVDVAGHSDHPS